jgi:hypothetical protein
MAWHVASRSAWSTHGALSNELRAPLDAEYALNRHHAWWQPKQRLGQLERPATTAPPSLKLPQLQTYSKPVYPPSRTGPVLREHIYMTRPFRVERVPPGQMVGSVPLAAMSNPRLAQTRGLQRPQTPVYDGSVYDGPSASSWSTAVRQGVFFGHPH